MFASMLPSRLPFVFFSCPTFACSPAWLRGLLPCLASALGLWVCLCCGCCFFFPYGRTDKKKGRSVLVRPLLSCCGCFLCFDKVQKENDVYFLFPALRFPVCFQLYALGRGGYQCHASVNCPQELLFVLHPLVCIHYQIPIIVSLSVLDISSFCYSCHIALCLIV